MAPTQKLYEQFPFEKRILTSDEVTALNEERARLIFFAQIEYTDQSGGVKYTLPFCHMYHPDMVGNVIFCKDDVTFREIEKREK